MATSRLVRIFISSTFRDFRLERDELVKKVFPELRRRSKNRFVEVVEVDLRWGVTDEQSLKGETLRICLAEIDKCRPSNPVFFIGLLGERYGWIPPHDYYPNNLLENEKTSWVKEHIGGKSVTELEILHGVLNNPKMAKHAFFYFRSPGYIEECWDEIVQAYPDSKKEDFRNQGDDDRLQSALNKKQEDLKNRIRSTAFLKNSVRDVDNHHELADRILEDLWHQIDLTYPTSDVPDIWERQTSEHESFALSRTKSYVPRSGMFDALDTILTDTRNPVRVVTGESGGGKSALLAAWLEGLRSRGELPSRTFFHFIGGTPESSTAQNIVSRLVNALKTWGTTGTDIPEDYRDVLIKLPSYLEAAGKLDGGVLIVLDALNQLESPEDKNLQWLPAAVPDGARLVLSTLPGKCADELKRRGWLQPQTVLKVGPLATAERRAIISTYLGMYTKSLPAHLVDRLAESEQCANALFLMVLLNEMRVRGQHESLASMLENYLSCPGLIELFVKVLKSLEEFNESRKNLVQDALRYIATARRGLTETELLELLSTADKPAETPLPRAHWSPLYLALEESLISRNGRMSFFHDYLHQAVVREYLDEESERVAAHGRLAEVALAWNTDRFGPSLRTYGLEFGSDHLYESGDHENLWKLLKDEEYRNEQISTFKQYTASLRSMQNGINAYIARDGERLEDDVRLCWLVFRAEELGRQYSTDLQIAFEWAGKRPLDDPERMNDVLQRLELLSEQKYFKALLLLLWIESERRSADPEDTCSTRDVDLILEAAVHRIPAGPGTIKWNDFLLVEFLILLVRSLLRVFDIGSDARFLELIGHASNKKDMNELIYKLVEPCKNHRFTKPHFERLADFCFSLVKRTPYYDKNSYILTAAAKAQALAGNFDGAQATITQALASVNEIADINQIKIQALVNISSALFQSGKIEQAHSTVEQALSLAADIKNDQEKASALNAIAWELVNAGEAERAQPILQSSLSIIEGMPDESGRDTVFSSTSLTLSQAKMFSHALVLAERIEEEDAKVYTLAYISADLEHAGEDKLAQATCAKLTSLAKKIIENGCRDDSIPALASYLAHAGMFSQALTLTTLPQGKKSNLYKSVGLAWVIRKLAQADNTPERDKFFTQAQLLMDKLEIGNDQSKVQSAMAAALAQTGNVERAQRFFSQSFLIVDDSKKEPDRVEHLAAIAKECSIAGNSISAEAAFSAAQAIASRIRLPENRDRAQGSIINALSKARLFDRALHELTKIDNDSNKSDALRALLPVLVQAKEVPNLADLFLRIQDIVESIKTDSSRSEALTTFILSMIQVKEIPNLADLLSKIPNIIHRIKDDSSKYNALISFTTALVQFKEVAIWADMFPQIPAILLKIKDDKHKSEALIAYVQALVETKQIPNWADFFSFFQKIVESITDESCKMTAITDSISALTQIAGSRDRAGFLSEITGFIKKVKGDANKHKTLIQFFLTVAKHSDPRPRQTLFEKIASLTKRITDDHDKGRFVSELVKAIAQDAGLPDRKTLLAKILPTLEDCEDIPTRSMIHADMARAHSLIGDVNSARLLYTKALSFVDEIEDHEKKAGLLAAISFSMAKAGEFDQAQSNFSLSLSVGNEITSDWEKARFFYHLAGDLLQAGMPADRTSWYASRLFDLARNWANSPPQIEGGLAFAGLCKLLNSIGMIYVQTRDVNHAHSAFTLFLDLIEYANEKQSGDLVIFLKNVGRLENFPDKMSLINRASALFSLNWMPSSCPFHIQDLLPFLANTEGHTAFLGKLLLSTERFDDNWDKANALIQIGTALAKIGEPASFVEALNRTRWPHGVLQEILPKWREALLGMKIPPLSHFRESMNLLPFQRETAYNGTFSFLQALYVCKKIDHAQAIIRACPQFGFECLLEENDQDQSNEIQRDSISHMVENQNEFFNFDYEANSGICREQDETDDSQIFLTNQIVILNIQAKRLFSQKDLDGAMGLCKEIERICREIENRHALQRSLGNQGLILYQQSNLDCALLLSKEQEKLCRELGEPDALRTSLKMQIAILDKQAIGLYDQGNFDEALILFKEVERISREIAYQQGIQTSLGNQALILSIKNVAEDALLLYKEQADICRKAENFDCLTRSLANQAQLLAYNMNRPQDALTLAAEALDLAERHGLNELAKWARSIFEDVKRRSFLATLTANDDAK